MFQIVFITVVSAVIAVGFIFFSTTSEGAEESSELDAAAGFAPEEGSPNAA